MMIVVVVVVVAIALLDGVGASHEFVVHRAVQFDVGNQTFGSQSRRVVNLPGAFGESTPIHSIRLVKACADGDDGFDLTTNSTASLVIVPNDPSDEQIVCLKQMERSIMERSWPSPIYFSFENGDLNEIFDQVVDETADRQQFMINAPEAPSIASPRIANLFGWLSSKRSTSGDIIAIVAGWDSISAIPGLGSSDGSSVAGILELMRIFRRIYETEGLGRHSLLFVLTGASAVNAEGSRHLLADIDARILDRIQLVICLDSLSTDQIYVHCTPSTADSDSFLNFQRALSSAGDAAALNFQTVISDVDDESSFEHGPYATEHLTAMTLSSRRSPSKLHRFSCSSAFDEPVDVEMVSRSIGVIAEALAQFIFDVNDAGLVKAGSSVHTGLVLSWLHYLSSTPRVAAALPKGSSLVQDLLQEMNAHLSSVEMTSFLLSSSSYRFYTFGPKTIKSWRVKPFLFEVALGLSVGSYLTIIYLTAKRLV